MYPSSIFISVVYDCQDIDVRIHDVKFVLHSGNKGNYFWPRFKTTPILVNILEIPAQSDPAVTIGYFRALLQVRRIHTAFQRPSVHRRHDAEISVSASLTEQVNPCIPQGVFRLMVSFRERIGVCLLLEIIVFEQREGTQD